MKNLIFILCLLSLNIFGNENQIIEELNVPNLNKHKIRGVSIDSFGNIFFISQYGFFEVNNFNIIDHNQLIKQNGIKSYFKHIQVHNRRSIILESDNESSYIVDLAGRSIIDQKLLPKQSRLEINPQFKDNNKTCKDINGDIITANWGLKRITNSDKNSFLIKETKDLKINGIAEFKNKIFFGTDSGLYYLDNKIKKIGTIGNENGLSYVGNKLKKINTIYNTTTLYKANNRLFIGTTHGLYIYSDNSLLKKINGLNILSIYSWNNKIFYGTKKIGVYSYDLEKNKLTNYGLDEYHITSLAGNEDKLYLGSLLGGLYLYENKKWINIANHIKVISLLYKSNKLWIGTLNSGLYIYENEQLLKLDSMDKITGLRSANNNKIVVIGSESYGIYDISKKQYKHKKVILDHTSFNLYNSSFVSSDNTLYIGQSKGLFVYKELDIDTKKPELKVKNYKIYNQDKMKETEYRNKSEIKLSWPYNGFSFDFLITPYKDNLKYNYTLRNNEEIIYNYKSNNVLVYNLDPGSYILDIEITSPLRELIDYKKQINVTVSPPFWLTVSFWLIVVVIALFLSLIIYRIRIENVKKTNEELQEIVNDISESLISDARKKERERLARDLHDSVSQTLFSASITAEVLPEILKQNPTEALNSIEELKNLTKEAQIEMRSLLYELHPEIFQSTPLNVIVEKLVNNYINSKVELNTNISSEPEFKVKSILYRICQESLNNIKKHSKASEISIALEITNNKGQLVIRDNGKGFSLKKKGMGIKIMEERAESIGGDLTIKSNENGTVLTVNWS